MSDDHKELIEYLDEKFLGVENRFEKVDQRFLEIEHRFDRIDQRFDEMGQDFNDLQAAVDAYAKRADAYFQEMTMLSAKVDRLERWIQQVAEKTGVQLKS